MQSAQIEEVLEGMHCQIELTGWVKMAVVLVFSSYQCGLVLHVRAS